MIDKRAKIKDAIDLVKSDSTLMIGGFTLFGCPLALLRELSTRDVTGLTTISEDTGFGSTFRDWTATDLFEKRMIKQVCTSFIGNNKAVNDLIHANAIELELIPQGTLAERIRAAGAGLGGFYTPTGVGTVVENGKEKRVIDGKEYLLESPLTADFAFIKAYKADWMGNAIFKYTAMNFNPLMAMAAKTVILEAEEVVPAGEINPEDVQLPGVFVDYVVKAGGCDLS